MPDDNRFDEIGDALEADEAEASNEASASQTAEEPHSDMDDDDREAASSDEIARTTVYATAAVLEEYKSAIRQAKAELVMEGNEDVKKQELHQAALELASEDSSAIVERWKEARGEGD